MENNIQIMKQNMIIEKQKEEFNKMMNISLENFCNISNDNNIMVNYTYFKKIKPHFDEEFLIQYMSFQIEQTIEKYGSFVIHAHLTNLNLLDFDKYSLFVLKMADYFQKKRFPEKLHICHIYDVPFIFKQIYPFLCKFMDRVTLSKISLKNKEEN
jgi:CRAL/TRIO domain